MELEIIEPCLFLGLCPNSEVRFAQAIAEWLEIKDGK